MLSESKTSKSFDFNPAVSSRATSNLSNGLRYTQNTTSAVSSPRLTNNRPGSLAGSCTPLRKNTLCDQRRSPATNSFTPNIYNERDASQNLLRSTISPSVSKQSHHLRGTGGSEVRNDSLFTHNRIHDSNPSLTSNRYRERDSSQKLLRSTMSPSVSKQTPEFRIANDSSNHLRGTGRSEIGNDSLSTHNRTNSNPPVTPNRYTHRDSSVDKHGSKVSTSANSHTPKLRGFPKESPVQRNLRTPTTERRCFTPRRFPGPAGILPRLDPGQSLDNLQSPSLETPTKKSPQLCQLVTGDSDEDFAIEPWTLMQEKISKDFPDSLDCLSSVITKAASHQLERGKVAFLPVLVKSFRPTGLDVSIVLKDPSGEMRGTLHRKVLEQQEIEIGPGCGLFLKQVSVFSPSPRKHYLNITPGNILEIFPASAERCGSRKIAEATPKSGPKVMQKQAVCSNSNKEIEQAHSFEETNFDELLEGLDDDDDILVEAMNC
ncbi:Hypothetical predicted protein [Paramuricea clavata]|uniref:Homologous recombination OB-fold protein OB-fold domain-containing protein n=1 Tax=Paramuricea clavata TaxID=317549 RepID=A0A7D9E7I4_PARCT|nr:Hypothetical predicted protein [Paramuricea clavata]